MLLNYSTVQSLPVAKSNKQEFISIKHQLLETTDRCDISTRADVNAITARFKAINTLPYSAEREEIELEYFKYLREYNAYVINRKRMGSTATRITRVRPTDIAARFAMVEVMPIVNKAELSVLALTNEFLTYKTKFNKQPFELYCLVDSLLNTILQYRTTPPNELMSEHYRKLHAVVSLGMRLTTFGIY